MTDGVSEEFIQTGARLAAVKEQLAKRVLGQDAVIEQVLRHVPAAVFFINAHLNRDLDVVEEHLVQVVSTVDRKDRPHRDPRRAQLDEEVGQPPVALGFRVGAEQPEAPFGERPP